MTYYLFIDEKGPQNKMKVQDKLTSSLDNNPGHKFKLSDDIMTTYFAAGLLIEKTKFRNFEKDFLEIENQYRSKFLKSSNTESELKGAKILKKKTTNGFASLTTDIVMFYNQLFTLIKKHGAKLCILTESKVENIVENILNNLNVKKAFCEYMNEKDSNWYKDSDIIIRQRKIDKGRKIIIYSLAKYLINEPSPHVIKILNSGSFTIKEILTAIMIDLNNIIDNFNNKERDPNAKGDNQRGSNQKQNYEEMIEILENIIHQKNLKSITLDDSIGNFNWKKIIAQLCNFFSDSNINSNDVLIYLDEGIKKTDFEKINLKGIHEGINSKNCPGVRICDLIVTLVGSIASKLSQVLRYNPESPLERTLIPQKWFQFSNKNIKFANGENHFKLIRNLNSKLNKDISYQMDIFNDDLQCFIAYTNFLSYFKSYTELTTYIEQILNDSILRLYIDQQNSIFNI